MGGDISHVFESRPPVNVNITDVKLPALLKSPLLSDTAEFAIRIIFYVILSCSLSLFGLVANIINIVVFARLGIFTDGSNVNLFFLSVSDLGCVATNLLHGIGFSIVLADTPHLLWDPFDVLYMVAGWPHYMFRLATRVLTTYVAMERCLCVMLPFRVKTLFAPRRSLIYILTIFAYIILSHVGIFWTHRLYFRRHGATNVSKLVLTASHDHIDIIHDVIYYTNYFVVSFACVIMVIVCTLITSSHIRTSKDWRKSVSQTAATKPRKDTKNIEYTNSPSNRDSSSPVTDVFKDQRIPDTAIDKETRLVKMITLISVIFLICYVPEFVLILMQYADQRIQEFGQYHRLAHLMYSIIFVTTTFNSSINIFVYFKMSTKYKNELKKWCRKMSRR